MPEYLGKIPPAVRGCMSKIRQADRSKAQTRLERGQTTGKFTAEHTVYLCKVCLGYHIGRSR
jgi:hypothetical protein